MDAQTTIIYLDGSEVVVPADEVIPNDLVELEDRFSVDAGEFQEHPRMKYTMFLLWLVVSRHGETRDFDEWRKQVRKIVEPQQEAPAPVPLERRTG